MIAVLKSLQVWAILVTNHRFYTTCFNKTLVYWLPRVLTDLLENALELMIKIDVIYYPCIISCSNVLMPHCIKMKINIIITIIIIIIIIIIMVITGAWGCAKRLSIPSIDAESRSHFAVGLFGGGVVPPLFTPVTTSFTPLPAPDLDPTWPWGSPRITNDLCCLPKV